MKINVNKKVVAALLAGTMTFTLVGCSSKNSNEYELPSVSKNIEINFNNDEIDNEIDNEQAKENYTTSLMVSNLPDNTKITLHDGTNKQLTEFPNDNNSYQIPSSEFTINFNMNNKNYSYNISGNSNQTVYVSANTLKDNELQFNIEKNNSLSFNELQDTLADYNINVDSLINNNDLNVDIIERHNTTYVENDITSDRSALYINNLLLNEETKTNNDTKYYSPLRVGDGINNIEIIDNETVKLSYERTFVDDYKFIDNIENNINYFFNNINNTKDTNYYKKGDLDLVSLVNEETEIKEHIEKFYNGEKSCTRYYYSYNTNNDSKTLIEFGQVNYDNEFFMNDPHGYINTNSKDFKMSNYNTNYKNTSSNSEYVHYYSDDLRTPTGGDYTHYYSDDHKTPSDGDYTHYYSDDHKTPSDGDYTHYYSDDYKTPTDGDYVHYYSDDVLDNYLNNNYDDEIYEYEEEPQKKY